MIQDHVTSLELSKQLYEAGIVVESEFWWCNRGVIPNEYPEWEIMCKHYTRSEKIKHPAPLSSELGELLPKKCSYYPGRDNDWCCHYQDGSPAELSRPFLVHREYSDTEANARAKMLLYLKEKGLL